MKTYKKIEAVLFDMDGILYDSMPGHARAWKRACDESGITTDPDEFYAYEGRTGASTINLLYNRQFGYDATSEDVKRIYDLKCKYFKQLGPAVLMPGAVEAVKLCKERGVKCVLVTGSGQPSLLERLDRDFENAFTLRVTARDVTRGKPDPEPYLAGLAKAGVSAADALAVDNAPLGVESASRAGIFTIGVRTGPIPEDALLDSGADIELRSMKDCTKLLADLL